MADSDPHCGQAGRVCRVFWRAGAPWVLVRCSSGMMVAVPWHATDLPVPALQEDEPAQAPAPPLLSPDALLALVRHLDQRADAAIPRRLP
jgi:hypothetical protein